MSRASLFFTVVLSASLFACSSSKSGTASPDDGSDGSIPNAQAGSELGDVRFDFDSSSLSSNAQETLKANAKWLVSNASARFIKKNR